MLVGILCSVLSTAPGPTEIRSLMNKERVQFEWIVQFTPGRGVDDIGIGTQLRKSGTAVVLKLSDTEAELVSNSESVVWIVPNLVGRLSGTQNQAGGAFSTSLNRLDQRGPISSGGNADYQYSTTGRGVTIYILDDAILATHNDFTTLPWELAYFGARSVSNAYDATLGFGAGPQANHGTQMASIAAGIRGGTAKGAQVKVIDVVRAAGFVELDAVNRAIDWITANHPIGSPAVVNMSLEFPLNSMLNNKVQGLIASRGLARKIRRDVSEVGSG